MAINRETEIKSELVAMILHEVDRVMRELDCYLICSVVQVQTEEQAIRMMHCPAETVADSLTQGVKGLLEIAHGEGHGRFIPYRRKR